MQRETIREKKRRYLERIATEEERPFSLKRDISKRMNLTEIRDICRLRAGYIQRRKLYLLRR